MAQVQKVGREVPITATVERFDLVDSGGASDVVGQTFEALKARISLAKSGSHVDYTIRVVFKTQSWTVTRRFNEFAALSDALKGRLAVVPEMPAKSMVRQFGAEYLDARKRAEADAVNCKELQQFLMLPQRVPDFADFDASEPVQTAEVHDAAFGIADFDYDPVQGLLLIGSSDFSWTSRVDTKITNIRMPWEKQAPNLPSSQMSLWQQSPADLKFEMVSATRFPGTISSVILAAGREKGQCLCGLSDGTIGCHTMKAERFAVGSTASVLPLVRHTAGVVALALDETEQWLFSASSDKAIIVFDLRRQMIQCEVQASAAPVRMYHCQVQRRLFTALKNGQVIVWDTSVLPLQRLAVVPDGASPASGPITALDYDLSTSTLFTGSKEGISLWAVKASDSGCSGWGRKLGQFSSMSSAPTAVAWAISSREVMAGFANGAVVIFDLDKGEASYAIQAHSDEVTAVMWLDAPRRLLTASKDKTLKIWDFPSLQRAPLDAISLTSSSMSQKV
eukprot:CAMPEP_0115165998 /NCGR_PEP_ID=MMETSP0227-20121206/73891_1 /TAXON_ID=89957 /ORGANISM="Polarella glacialis, Strain CCMP 1383" /LENGTH=506 /DNA_ID=CAMNT_0002578507 /DNA_START=19 /DNA_END=1537 /DNA_ORIENTATION=-